MSLSKDLYVLAKAFEQLENTLLKAGLRKVIECAIMRLEEVDGFVPDEIQALKNGSRLECVRLVRNRLGLGLLDAKHYVEARMDKYYVKREYPQGD